jgi:hypothetical protein
MAVRCDFGGRVLLERPQREIGGHHAGEHDVLGLKMFGFIEGQAQGPVAIGGLFVIALLLIRPWR